MKPSPHSLLLPLLLLLQQLAPIQGLRSPVTPANVSIVRLTEAAAATGAVSLDGSPGALYIDFSPSHSDKWIVWQEGGECVCEVCVWVWVVPSLFSSYTPALLSLSLSLCCCPSAGGWCNSVDGCRERANSTLGSTKSLPEWSTEVMRSVDYLSNDPSINPVLADW
jgi:hypothetical protein